MAEAVPCSSWHWIRWWLATLDLALICAQMLDADELQMFLLVGDLSTRMDSMVASGDNVVSSGF